MAPARRGDCAARPLLRDSVGAPFTDIASSKLTESQTVSPTPTVPCPLRMFDPDTATHWTTGASALTTGCCDRAPPTASVPPGWCGAPATLTALPA